MKVHVRLFANLRERLPEAPRGRASLELDPGETLQGLLDRLDIPPPLAQMVLVDGQQAPRDRGGRTARVLAEGETVSVFPPLAGG